mmetsp:Transcript_77214/g.238347  ORF Transcript_77214/g.238347 Transcript_77214/m.238347 type:complete len:211 (-) Transcript_77214:92-724(-)
MGDSGLGTSWRRSYSSGDIRNMQRHMTPASGVRRRLFDSALSMEEAGGQSMGASGFESSGLRARLREAADHERSGHDVTRFPGALGAAAGGSSAGAAASEGPRERAVDCWRMGESMRIMHHIEPRKSRPISLHGEVFQGHYRHDWQNVKHIQDLRSMYPALREGRGGSKLPYPQGMTQRELLRNRCFDRSHGSSRFPRGMLTVGSQCLVP